MNLKSGETKLHKKEFYRSKQPIYSNQGEIKKIVISDKFKFDDGVKNFIGCKNGEIVTPLCIILPQISGFIKYFEFNKGNKSFLADDYVILKHKNNKKKFRKLVGVEFYSQPVYNEKYIKTRVKTFEDKTESEIETE